MRKFVIGDIHGEDKKLEGCLELVNFDYGNDMLISLGDIVDRGPNSYRCVEILMKIKNLVVVRGNHDQAWIEAMETGVNWMQNERGRETLLSYTRYGDCENDPSKAPFEHQLFFKNQKPYYIDEDNNLFIHGGFNRHLPIADQNEETFYWDRDLFSSALASESRIEESKEEYPFKASKEGFKKIFVGHTPTLHWGTNKPIKAANVYNLDTGCGKGPYPLTIMNVDTEEYWQFNN